MTSDLPLQQSEIFAKAMALINRPTEQVADTLILRRRPFPALASRPLLSGNGFKLLARHGVRLINAERPQDAPALRAAGFRQIMTPAHIAELDLSQTREQLRAAMQGKWRNRLAAAQARGLHQVHHRVFDPARDAWLLKAEAAQQKRRQYRALPPALTLAMSQASPESSRLFTCADAAMLFVLHGRRASYHIGHSGPEGRAASAHNLLLATAMKALPDHGIRWLELGTIDTETAASLARFKLGSGASVRALGGTWLRALP
ncbi:GNAT family N-acetyltransferase [Lentibacter algarum]|uniref:GNAT family N-acetyltransferase n=1 Tax=Lentibacter algarum TaxID=576131 RepID=UPI001C09B7A8|nr:GNAT family N-acetyltransferase [Lentibacter algarum]MBU2983204.1 GNAT family N-acetyltransferase [Lentibacter algarum]